MKKIAGIITICAILCLLPAAFGREDPGPRERLAQVKEFLESFRLLTERYLREKHGAGFEGIYSREGIKGIPHTGWEIQHIGFANIPRLIEKSMLEKDLAIARFELRVAELEKKPERARRGLRVKIREIEKKLRVVGDEGTFVD